MANGKLELIEDISDIRRLAGLAEAPKKAAPAAANPDPNNYGSFSTNNKSPYGFAAPGSDDDTSANFFASDKRMRDAQTQQSAPKAAAPKPAAPKPNLSKVTPGSAADTMRQQYQGPDKGAGAFNDDGTIAGPPAAAPAKTPSDYKSPLVNYPDRTDGIPNRDTNAPRPPRGEPGSRDPRPPANLVNPMDQYTKPTPTTNGSTTSPFRQNAPSPLVTNLDGTPRPQGGTGRDPRPPANPTLNIGGQNFTPPVTAPAPVTQLPSQEYRGQAGTSDGVARYNAPALDKAFNSINPNTNDGGNSLTNQPAARPPAPTKIEPFKGDMGDTFRPARTSFNTVGSGQSADFADKDPDTMKDIVKELRQMAGIPDDGIPGQGMAQEAMAQFESEGKKPDFLDVDQDGDKEEAMTKALDDKEEEEEKVEEGIEVNPINDSLALMKRLAGI